MGSLSNPISILSRDLFIAHETGSSFMQGGPPNSVLYTILHGFFTVLVMKEFVSILRSLVKGNHNRVSFNRILLWHMVENWEDVFKIVRIFIFPRRMHVFPSKYHPLKVHYNRLAWKRFCISGLMAFFIFGADMALISFSTSSTTNKVGIDWGTNETIPTIISENIVRGSLSRAIPLRDRSNDVKFVRTPSFVWEKIEVFGVTKSPVVPQIRGIDNVLIRCDTLGTMRWRIICHTQIAHRNYMYILRIDADIPVSKDWLDMHKSAEEIHFPIFQYQNEIEKQLRINVTSAVSTQFNFRDEFSRTNCTTFVGFGKGTFAYPTCQYYQDCNTFRSVQGDCRIFFDSATEKCKTKEMNQNKSSDYLNTCEIGSCETNNVCNHMGFAIGTNSNISQFTYLGKDSEERRACELDLESNSSPQYSKECVQTTDVIASIFLHSIQLGTRYIDSSYEYIPKLDTFSAQDSRRSVTISQGPPLPLYATVVIYIILQLISILLQTRLGKHPISPEMNIIAEMCGAKGVENLMNMNLEDREIIYSFALTGEHADVPVGHCGYLPSNIMHQVRDYFKLRDTRGHTFFHNVSKFDMKDFRNVDGCIV